MNNALDPQSVIKTYTLLYKLIFRFGYIVVACLGGVAIMLYILFSFDAPVTRQKTQQETDLIVAFDTLQQQSLKHPDIQTYIMQGPIDFAGNFLSSFNNYATYKGFVLPQTIRIDQNLPLKNKEYFSSSRYTISELELYLKNFVYTQTTYDVEDFLEAETISLPVDIIDFFQLRCASAQRYIDDVCDAFTQNFIDHMHVYSLSLDYAGLNKIGSTLIQTPHKDDFCHGLTQYIIYTNDNSNSLTSLFEQCGGAHKETFDVLKWYVLIQQELAQEAISNNVFVVPDLNAYKLLSTMQSLYQDIKDQQFDETKMLGYIKYVEALMRESDRLDPLYFDMVYSFHHDFLLRELSSLARQLPNKRDDIQDIIERLKEIEEEDDIINHEGLVAYLVNPGLVDHYGGDITPVLQDTSTLTLQERFEQFGSFEKMRLVSTAFTGEIVSLTGEFVIDTALAQEHGIERKLSFVGSLERVNQQFVIGERDFVNYDRMSTIVSDILSTQSFTVPQLYDYVTDNLATLLAKTEINVSVCTRLQESFGKKLTDCDESMVRVDGVHPWTKKEVPYMFRLSGFQLDGFLVGDRFLYEVLADEFVERETNELTIADTIVAIVEANPTDPRTVPGYEPDVGANKLYIIEQIQTYLGVVPRTVQERDGAYLVALSLSSIDFILNYDISNNVLGPLVFADQPQIRIMDFALVLDESSRDAHDDFVNETLEYLSTIDEEAVRQYRVAQ